MPASPVWARPQRWNSNPNGSVWLPNEVDVSIRRPDWFWSASNANLVLTPDQLLSIYFRSVGHGAQLLLNIPPNRDGLMDQKDRQAAASFGAEIRRRFGSPLASTCGSGREIVLELNKPRRIDTVILREDIALGERVRAYVLEGKVGGDWIALANGTAIGHKRIQPLEARVVDAVRLRIAEAAASPQVRTLAVFDTGTQPPADWNAVSELWAPNLVGHWRDGRFSLELGKSIPAAAQYTLRFVPASGEVQGFRHVSLLIGGVASPEFIHPSRTRKDQLLLDITAPNHSVLASGEVLGAERGEITLDSAR